MNKIQVPIFDIVFNITTCKSVTVYDEIAAKRLRKLRLERGLSQRELAKHLGITFQQLQKYEKAQNRITIGRLSDICKVLEVKPEYFFI